MSPKQRFIDTSHAESHRALVKTEAFQEALRYAMLESLENMANTSDGAAQMTGIKAFCKTLTQLADVDKDPQTPRQPPTIDHDAYDPRRTSR